MGFFFAIAALSHGLLAAIGPFDRWIWILLSQAEQQLVALPEYVVTVLIHDDHLLHHSPA